MNDSIIATDLTVCQVSLADGIKTFVDVALAATSRQTVAWYAKRLDMFQRFMGDRLLSDLIEADLWDWYRDIETRVHHGRGHVPGKISVFTQHGYVRAVRRLFGWFYERDLLPVDLARDLKLPRLPKNGEKGINDSDVLAILKAARDHPRDYALLTFIESTGCRRGGVADLRLSDLNLDSPEPVCRRATVREKGNKEREVPMSPRALAAMRAWMKVRESSTDFVFVDVYPDREDHYELSPDGVSQILRRYKTQLGIKRRVSPHQWRHRLGRKLARQGMPLNQISQILGHRSVVVTADFYGTFAMDALQEAMDKYYADPEKDE